MAEHGGYRKPSHPAAVSGPGAHSRRTDGAPIMDLPDAKYGEAQQFDQIQHGAAMGGPSGPAAGAPQEGTPMPTPIGAPTGNPGQPVTAGADAGLGPDSSVLGIPNPANEAEDLRQRYGDLLPFLVAKADSKYASQEFRAQVRYLLAHIG